MRRVSENTYWFFSYNMNICNIARVYAGNEQRSVVLEVK